MRLRVASHLYAETILSRAFADEWSELQSTLGGLGTPSKASTRRAQTMRAQLSSELLARGWVEVQSSIGSSRATHSASTLRKRGALLEVELGAAAYVYRALLRFLALDGSGESDVGILVLPTEQTASLLGRGRATWEQAVQLLPYLRAGIHLPIAIVGLDPDSSR